MSPFFRVRCFSHAVRPRQRARSRPYASKSHETADSSGRRLPGHSSKPCCGRKRTGAELAGRVQPPYHRQVAFGLRSGPFQEELCNAYLTRNHASRRSDLRATAGNRPTERQQGAREAAASSRPRSDARVHRKKARPHPISSKGIATAKKRVDPQMISDLQSSACGADAE